MKRWLICLCMLTGIGVQADLIVSGSGSVSTASGTGFKTAAAQAYALRYTVSPEFVAGAQISITGSMTLSGVGNTPANDRVGFVFGNSGAVSSLQTVGAITETTYGLFANTTVNYPGTNEQISVAQKGVTTTLNSLVEGAPSANTLNYAINLTFPLNYADGTNALGHIYAYTFGFDYDQDGYYEYIESGTLDAYEADRIRLGFQVQKSPTDIAEIFTNNYTYNISTGAVSIVAIPEPATIGLLATAAVALLVVRRKIRLC